MAGRTDAGTDGLHGILGAIVRGEKLRGESGRTVLHTALVVQREAFFTHFGGKTGVVQ